MTTPQDIGTGQDDVPYRSAKQQPLPGFGDSDEGESDPSPIVLVACELFTRLATMVEQGTVDFDSPPNHDHTIDGAHPFNQAVWQLYVLGANLDDWAALTTEIATAMSLKLWAGGYSHIFPEGQRLRVVQAGIDLLVRDGMVMAGRKYNPFTGRPRRSSPT